MVANGMKPVSDVKVFHIKTGIFSPQRAVYLKTPPRPNVAAGGFREISSEGGGHLSIGRSQSSYYYLYELYVDQCTWSITELHT